MESNTLATIALPIVLGLLMFGIGLSLSWKEFALVKKSPRVVLIALAIQNLVCPLFIFTLLSIFNFPSYICVGFMLLAATPGGPTSNLFSHLAKGDVALTITLAGINSIISIGTIPIWIYFSFSYFEKAAVTVAPPLSKLIQTVFIVLVPMIIGVNIKNRFPAFAIRSEKFVKKISSVFIGILAILGIKNEYQTILSSGLEILAVVVLFNFGNILISFFTAKFLKLEKRQAIAIVFEVSVHNCILAMAIAANPNLLNDLRIALPAIIYSIFMLFSASLLANWFSRQKAY